MNHASTAFSAPVFARVEARAGGAAVLLLRVAVAPAATAPSGLTPAEHTVASLALHGASNARIARERGSSVRTIAKQLASVFRKLHVASRSELALALLAQEHAAQKPVRVSGR